MPQDKTRTALDDHLQGSWAKALLTGLLCIGSGIIGAAFTRNFGTSNYTMSYADFVSIMLTAISLLMTLLAFFIAVLAWIGWNSISARVHDRTKEFLDEGFKEGNSLHTMLRARAREITYEGIMAIDISEEVAEEEERNREEARF